MKLKIQEDGNDNLSHKCKEDIKIIFHKSMDLLTNSRLTNNMLTQILYFGEEIKCRGKAEELSYYSVQTLLCS